MAENKTRPTKVSPKAFIESMDSEQRRKDGLKLLRLYREITGEPARMWGPTIVGFGSTTYRLASGREEHICLAGFSPRKSSLVLYIGPALEDKALLSRLGKHKTGKGCLYVNKLDDVDPGVLRQLIAAGLDAAKRGRVC